MYVGVALLRRLAECWALGVGSSVGDIHAHSHAPAFRNVPRRGSARIRPGGPGGLEPVLLRLGDDADAPQDRTDVPQDVRL
jgi:hypothetical protein